LGNKYSDSFCLPVPFFYPIIPLRFKALLYVKIEMLKLSKLYNTDEEKFDITGKDL
jgi:hypothetical protein